MHMVTIDEYGLHMVCSTVVYFTFTREIAGTTMPSKVLRELPPLQAAPWLNFGADLAQKFEKSVVKCSKYVAY